MPHVRFTIPTYILQYPRTFYNIHVTFTKTRRVRWANVSRGHQNNRESMGGLSYHGYTEIAIPVLRIDSCDSWPICSALFKLQYLF